MNEFSAGSCIALGWETFKKRPWFLIGVPVLALIILAVITGALAELQTLGIIFAIVVFLANIYVSTVYKMGSTNFVLKAVDDTASLKIIDYWRPRPFWQYLGAGILTGLCALAALVVALVGAGIIAGISYLIGGSSATLVGFFIALVILALIAFVFVAIVLMFVPYIVISEQPGPEKALKKSARITKGHRWTLLWLTILCLLLNVVGFICIIIGLFVTIPVTTLAVVHAYRILGGKASTPTPAV